MEVLDRAFSEIVAASNGTGESPTRPDIWRRARKVALRTGLVGSLAVAGVAVQNHELLSGLYEQMMYDQPSLGDIIPEKLGACSNLRVPESSGPNGRASPYTAASDEVMSHVQDSYSAASTFKLVNSNSSTQPMIRPSGLYFNEEINEFETSFGLKTEIYMRDGETPFSVHEKALDGLTALIFEYQIYANPDVQAIVACRANEVIYNGSLDGEVQYIGISADGNKGLLGMNVETFTDFASREGNIRGFAINGANLSILGKPLAIPERLLMIFGGNGTLKPNQAALNRIFLHEWIHALLFPDFSDTLAERDEQERLVQYMVRSIISHVDQTDSEIPEFILLN